MPKINIQEDEHHEFKEKWVDRALEDIAAFSNHKGGEVYIGVRDDGEILGFTCSDKENQRIVNQIITLLTVRPSIRSEKIKGKSILRISVTPQQGLISYKGRYYTRVGSTNQQLSPEQMAQRVLQMSWKTWDTTSTSWNFNSIDKDQVERFLSLAKNRLPLSNIDNNLVGTLQKLSLIRDHKLTAAAALLFTEKPQSLFSGAQIQVGRFQGNTILDSQIIGGSLWSQVDNSIIQLRKMLGVRFDIRVETATLEGFQRKEIWAYPLEAIREALLNAIIHRDYTVLGNIEVRVYDDRMSIWSPGKLAPNISLKQFYEPVHPSIRRNPLIAEVFYFANLIERWGTGTTRIVQLCVDKGLPTPMFEEYSGGIRTTLFLDPFTIDHLEKFDLNKQQISAVLYVKKHGHITTKEYQKLSSQADETARRHTKELVKKGIFAQRGKGRGSHYILASVSGRDVPSS